MVDPKINKQNDRGLAKEAEDVPIVMRSKNPASVMVLTLIANTGDVRPPHFFPKGLKINKEVYLQVLADKVKPWLDKVTNGRPYVFQQDGALAHSAMLVQNWLRENVPLF